MAQKIRPGRYQKNRTETVELRARIDVEMMGNIEGMLARKNEARKAKGKKEITKAAMVRRILSDGLWILGFKEGQPDEVAA